MPQVGAGFRVSWYYNVQGQVVENSRNNALGYCAEWSRLRESAVCRLLTNNLADRHRIREGTGLAAPTRVHSHHAYTQQVPGCQILDAVAVTRGQVLVNSHPVCCWRNKERLCMKKSVLVPTSLKLILDSWG